MRIIYIITGLGMGGAETITIDIANRMVKLGHLVVIIYLTGENALKENINKEIKVFGINMKKNPFNFILSFFRIKSIICRFKPDVVHANMVHANLLARILRLFTKIPNLVCTEHSINIEGKFRMILYRITDFLSSINTHVSDEAMQHFINNKAFSPQKSITVYNGIELTKDSKQNADEEDGPKFNNNEFIFINIGRMTQPKDQRSLIIAFSLFCKSVSNAELLIIGDGPFRNELKKLTHELLLEEKITFLGIRNDVAKFYEIADCFVLSSEWEGLPMVILEAMSHSLPIITTNVGGALETIQESDYIVPKKDPIALSKKMIQIYNLDKETRKMIGYKNRQLVNKFDINNIIKIWNDIYCHGEKTIISKK